MNKDYERINRALLLCWTIMAAILTGTYILEVIKGSRTIGYIIIFLLLTITPVIFAWILYTKNRNTASVKWICAVGYMLMYAYVLLTGNTVMVFVYIWLIIILMMMYSDPKLILAVGVTAILVNLVSAIYCLIVLHSNDTADREIQMAGIILCVGFAYTASRVIKTLNTEKLENIRQNEERQTDMLTQIANVSNVVKTNSTMITESLATLTASTDRTTTAISEIVSGTANTTELVEEQLRMTSNIQEIITATSDISTEIQSLVVSAQDTISLGITNINHLSESAKQSEDSNAVVAEQMQALTTSAESVMNIVSMIDSITDMTNMLALNASIEAARAGEAGRGFSVVAGEINNLANQTKEATENIATMINDLKLQADAANKLVHSMSQIASEQNDIIYQTENTFHSITESVDSVNTNVEVQSEHMQGLVNANVQIIESINNISAISEEVTANSQETQEIASQNADVTMQITELANELMVSVDQLDSYTSTLS